MTTEIHTVGDLDADAEVLRFTGDRVHLPDGNDTCGALSAKDIQPHHRKTAAVLFDDTPICRECRGVAERTGNPSGEETLPTDVEVQG